MLKDGGNFDECIENGVDKIDDIIAVQKMLDNNQVKSISHGIGVAKYAKRVGDDYNSSKSGQWRETFTTEFKEKAGLKEAAAQAKAKEAMNLVEKFNKTKKKNYK